MRLLLLALVTASALTVAACSKISSAATIPGTNVYEVVLQGNATANGKLVFNTPNKITVPVSEGQSALDLALAVRAALQDKKQVVLCTEDRAERGFVLQVDGKVEINTGKSNLGGIAGSASQLIQRREILESVTREFYRSLSINDNTRLKGLAADSFYADAAKELGTGITLVETGAPAIACHTASVMVEVALPGGQHDQRELQMVSDNALSWKVQSSRVLATWRPSAKSIR